MNNAQLATTWPVDIDPVIEPVDNHGPEPVAVPLLGFLDSKPDPTKTLLAERFLCKAGGMLFVGPSGIGKSSASMQQDTLWGLGREAFGIKPARKLKTLTIQAENDGGDLHEMVQGVCKGLNLNRTDLETVSDNVLYVSERTRSGTLFLVEVVEPLLEKHRPDIIRIDPLHAYLGGDVNNAQDTGAFLRNGLNPLLEKYDCGAIINHHTPKVINRDTTNWRGSDWMYAGAGSADVTNWARAALVIDPTHIAHIFKFYAAKRGSRIGWRTPDHAPEFQRIFCHDRSGGIFWREADLDDIEQLETNKPGKRGASKTKENLMALVPMDGAISKNTLISQAQTAGIGEKRARGFLDELVEGRQLHMHQIPRPKTNPEIKISRHEQTIP